MEIKLVEINEKELIDLNKTLENNQISEETFNELAKTINFSFSVENCSRLLSHNICESLDSYTQQSQRYVKMRENAFVTPNEIKNSKHEKEYKKINEELINFYKKITELKETISGRNANESDYKHGIKIEDGRYVLPLSITTNVFVTMNFSKIINFFRKLKQVNNDESKELETLIKNKINKKNVNETIDKYSNKIIDENIIYEHNKKYFNEINTTLILNSFENPIERSGLGAITSTNENPASEIKKKWETEKNALEKASGITKRVLSYNHTSIIEHARTNTGLEMSLTCYHQFERHRLPQNIREPFNKIPIEREIITPKTIQKSELYNEFKKIVKQAKQFRKKLKEENNKAETYLLLNCDKIKIINSTNARIDKEILKERLCNNAQWEIRILMEEKLKLLQKTSPMLYADFGPKCLEGKCPEGKLTCGKIIEVRNKYLQKNN